MPFVGFEPAISTTEGLQTFILNRMTTEIVITSNVSLNMSVCTTELAGILSITGLMKFYVHSFNFPTFPLYQVCQT